MTNHLFCVKRDHPETVVFVGSEQRCIREADTRNHDYQTTDYYTEPFDTHRWRNGFGMPNSFGVKETT